MRHMTLKDYVCYLQDYAAHFAVTELIRYKVKASGEAKSESVSEVIAIQKSFEGYECPSSCSVKTSPRQV